MRKFLFLAAIAALFASCNDVCDNLVSADDSNRVNAVTSIQSFTRATTASDSDLRSKGFWLTGFEGDRQVFACTYAYDKTAKMYTGPGYWANGTMDFYASYPASLRWDGTTMTGVDVSVDPLIATESTAKLTAVPFTFHHIASRIGGNVKSNLTSNVGDVSIANVVVSYTNIYTVGDYDGSAWSNPSSPAADVTLANPLFATYTNVVALADGAKITFDFDVTGAITAHRTYTYEVKELSQGYVYQYELTLNERLEAESVSVSKTIAVDDWNTQKEEITDSQEDLGGDTDGDTDGDEGQEGLEEIDAAKVAALNTLVSSIENDPMNTSTAEFGILCDVYSSVADVAFRTAYAQAKACQLLVASESPAVNTTALQSTLEALGVAQSVCMEFIAEYSNFVDNNQVLTEDKITEVTNTLQTAWDAFNSQSDISGEDASIGDVTTN